MSGSADILLASAIAIAVLMFSMWLLSLILKNASIVDIVWGLGFVVVAWVTHSVADGNEARGWLLTLLTTAWGLRLASYLAWRNIGHGEDFRYKAMRKHYGAKFPLVSLFTVFILQGVLMWLVSLPVQLGQVSMNPSIGVLGIVGVVFFAVGLFFETVGDIQLARFKANTENAGKVMQSGLWKYTRHPNYFGDACVWWGLALIAAEAEIGVIGILGAVAMSILLRRVSGVTLLEKSLKKRKEGYSDYVARTSAFIPRPPKKI
ncbi:MAG: DUF1295 domain-containing protein [bacterium]